MPLFLENQIRAFIATPHGVPHGVYHAIWDTVEHLCGFKCARVLDSVTHANEDFVYVDGIELPEDYDKSNPKDGNWQEYTYPKHPSIDRLINMMNQQVVENTEPIFNNDHENDGN